MRRFVAREGRVVYAESSAQHSHPSLRHTHTTPDHPRRGLAFVISGQTPAARQRAHGGPDPGTIPATGATPRDRDSGPQPRTRYGGTRVPLRRGSGLDMKFLVVTDDADRPALEEAMRHLRDRQRRAVIESTRAEIAADVDELLGMWAARG